MDINLNRSPHDQRVRFQTVATAADVADLLEVSYSTLVYHIFRYPEGHRYKHFAIRKRSGGVRVIRAPNSHLKILQQKLKDVLSNVYTPRRCAHGFVRERSTVTNAAAHIRATWVLNVDLVDFFPSIHFGRVRGAFMSPPLNRPHAAATVLARICCHDNQLPQGAPTSPVVSNLIAARLDGELKTLAARLRCRYSRYADDLTFSTYRPEFPEELATLVSVGDTIKVGVGPDLEGIILGNGFNVSVDKVSLKHRTQSQKVTGIVVNEKANVPRKYVRELRAILHSWRSKGYVAASTDYSEQYAKGDQHPNLPASVFRDFVKGKIGYLAMVRGINDPMVRRYAAELTALRTRDGV